MSRLRVLYRDEGVFDDRDAYYTRLQFWVDDDYLGVALGILDGLTLMRAPAGPDGFSSLYDSIPLATALRLKAMVGTPEMRAAWEVGALEIHLTAAEVEAAGLHESWQPNTLVLDEDV